MKKEEKTIVSILVEMTNKYGWEENDKNLRIFKKAEKDLNKFFLQSKKQIIEKIKENKMLRPEVLYWPYKIGHPELDNKKNRKEHMVEHNWYMRYLIRTIKEIF